jgi:hypothetical protein
VLLQAAENTGNRLAKLFNAKLPHQPTRTMTAEMLRLLRRDPIQPVVPAASETQVAQVRQTGVNRLRAAEHSLRWRRYCKLHPLKPARYCPAHVAAPRRARVNPASHRRCTEKRAVGCMAVLRAPVPPLGNKNPLKHGQYTREALAELKLLRDVFRQSRELLRLMK